MGGGVAAAVVAFTHCPGLHFFDAKQGIAEGRLAGTGAAHQHHALARVQPRLQRLHAGMVRGVHRQHRHVQRAQLRKRSVDVRALAVGLGQHDDRLHAAAGHQHQVAFDPARVEVRVQPADHEHGVDVGSDHLLLVVLAGGATLDRGVARQQRHDPQRAGRLALHRHPIPHGRARLRCRLPLAVAGSALPFRQRLRAMRRLHRFRDQVAASVLLRNPRRPRIGMGGQDHGPVRRQRILRPAPADGLQGSHARAGEVMPEILAPTPAMRRRDRRVVRVAAFRAAERTTRR